MDGLISSQNTQNLLRAFFFLIFMELNGKAENESI